MKAMVYESYGPPDIIQVREVPTPTPKRGEVLVRVRAASVNLSDWETLTGTPLYSRIWGLFRPRFQTLGSDIAGEVEAVGEEVTEFQRGDEVYGDVMGAFGSFAEYACVPHTMLVAKPADITFEEASTLPQAAIIALRGIHDRGQVQAGQHVLINGAGGGSGIFAVQMAKAAGAIVTGVDNSEKLDLMRSAGADHVVDYTREDFARIDRRYDLILDLVAHRSIFVHRRLLAPGGRYLMVGGAMRQLFQSLLVGPVLSLTSDRKLGLLAVAPKREDFAVVERYVAAGVLKPEIDRCFSLDQVADALRYVGEGHARGKVVILP